MCPIILDPWADVRSVRFVEELCPEEAWLNNERSDAERRDFVTEGLGCACVPGSVGICPLRVRYLPVKANLEAQYRLRMPMPFKAAAEPMKTTVPDLLLRK